MDPPNLERMEIFNHTAIFAQAVESEKKKLQAAQRNWQIFPYDW
jgi:hypothetical protein